MTVLEYNETTTAESQQLRMEAFSGRMTDLIQIEGLDFRYCELPFPEGVTTVFHDSRISPKLMKEGFKSFHRIQPRDPAVMEEIAKIGVSREMIGFHLRQTDSMNLAKIDSGDSYDLEVLERIRKRAKRLKLNSIYLAADNGDGRRKWKELLEAEGYAVSFCDSHEFDATR